MVADVLPWEAAQHVCPVCNAQVGKPCTVPTDTGRREVGWVHYARESVAKEARP